jgi:hypothetical protein
MTISLRKNRKLKEIQHEFNTIFPYLRIDFFNVLHKTEEVTSNNFIIDNEKMIGEYVKRNDVKKMSVDPKMTVSHFEQSFNPLGIGVQVFRKSGKIWLETGATDSWSLEDQNKEGESITNQYN